MAPKSWFFPSKTPKEGAMVFNLFLLINAQQMAFCLNLDKSVTIKKAHPNIMNRIFSSNSLHPLFVFLFFNYQKREFFIMLMHYYATIVIIPLLRRCHFYDEKNKSAKKNFNPRLWMVLKRVYFMRRWGSISEEQKLSLKSGIWA